jgi:hypothetical protein
LNSDIPLFFSVDTTEAHICRCICSGNILISIFAAFSRSNVLCFSQDIFYCFNIYSGSLETSVPWDKCAQLCENTDRAMKDGSKSFGIENFVTSYRLSQLYDAGAAVYFYWAFKFTPRVDPRVIGDRLEEIARDEILESGKLTDKC